MFLSTSSCRISFMGFKNHFQHDQWRWSGNTGKPLAKSFPRHAEAMGQNCGPCLKPFSEITKTTGEQAQEQQSHRAMPVSKSGSFWRFQNVGQILEKTHSAWWLCPLKGPLVSEKNGNVKHFVARLSDKPHHPQNTSSNANASLICRFQYEGFCSSNCSVWVACIFSSGECTANLLRQEHWLETIYGQRLACSIDTGWRQTDVGIPFHSTCAFHLALLDSMICCNWSWPYLPSVV